MDVQATDRLTVSAARPSPADGPVRSASPAAPPPPEPRPSEASPEPSRAQIERIERLLEQQARHLDRRVGISLDEQTGEPIVRITERESGELIRQIPPEELQRLAAKLDELRGLLVDRKA